MSRRIPHVAKCAAVAADISPSYNSGNTDLADTFAALIEQDDAKEASVREATWAIEEQAYAARKAGNAEHAAQLFDQLAGIWLHFGFKIMAESFSAFARAERTPPKTIGKKSKRGAR